MLKIVNGQFVDEKGNIVKAEFGNREQIDALKKATEEQIEMPNKSDKTKELKK